MSAPSRSSPSQSSHLPNEFCVFLFIKSIPLVKLLPTVFFLM